MAFFSRKQKEMALQLSNESLADSYHRSEQKLKSVARSGNEKLLKKAMKEHGNYEYAMLYKNTPEYKKKINQIKRCKY